MIINRYLAFDTSSVTGVVVAFEVSRVSDTESSLRIVAEWALSLETSRHSERLLWALDTVLQSAGWTLQDLSALAVGVGPGSFTGLRIGITTAVMLASQLNLKVIPLSSLVTLARGASDFLKNTSLASETTLILACTDATKGEWFSLAASSASIQQRIAVANETREKTEAPLRVIDEAKNYLQTHPASRWLAVGQSVERYASDFQSLPIERRIQAPTYLMQNQPRILAELAKESIDMGFGCDPNQIRPRYLRDSDAQVKLKKGLLKESPIDPQAPSPFQRGRIA